MKATLVGVLGSYVLGLVRAMGENFPENWVVLS
jgi:ABC-type phosphate transport system permease subunit